MADKYTIIVISGLTFLMIYIVYVIKSTNKGNITSNFTEKLVLLSSIFIPIGIYLTYTIFARQIQELRINATFRSIDRGWLGINKQFVENFDKCPNLIDSLAYDWQISALGKKQYKLSHEEDDWVASNYISNCIFQSMEDFMVSSALDETAPEVWISNFIPWANSEILSNHWSVLKFNYAPRTIELAEYLFAIVSKNRNQIKSSADIDKLAKDILKSSVFLDIMRKQKSIM
jgi:hypothetical protein